MIVYAGIILTSFVIALGLGWLLIPVLRRLKIGQSIREVGPKTHLSKSGVPTMGGIIFILAGLITALIFMPRQPMGYLVLFVTLAYGSIGFADDYLKVVLKQPLGLKARQKLVGQFTAAILFYVALRVLNVEHSLLVPGLGSITLGWAYPLFVVIFMVGTANAVNLADGVDGLAGGLGVISLLGLAIIASLASLDGLIYVSVALAGGILGYLVFNLHPARVIMGDTGSLALGGAIGAIAVLAQAELLFLAFFGIMFVLVTASVIIQVSYFKLTRRRVFLMAPLHHHFELKGWSEWKICTWFWIVQVIGVIAGLAVWFAAY